MPVSSTALPKIPHYIAAAPTNKDLEYADLPTLDFSRVHTTEGRAELAKQMRDARTSQGFFYVIDHGYTQSQNDCIFDIAYVPFSGVSNEEMQSFVADIKGTGSFQGYKPRQYWHVDAGVHDQIECYNILRHVTKKQHPSAVRPLLPEIEASARFYYFDVLHPILRLLALGMELSEDTFVKHHDYGATGETYVRFTKYHPRSRGDEEKTNVWLKVTQTLEALLSCGVS